VTRPIISFFVLGLAFGVSAPADGQTREERVAARQHFDRALALYAERQYDQALIEFQAAYDAVPNPALLYNIGNVHAALGHSVEAVDAFEAFFRESESVDPERRAEVEASLGTHRERIGRVHIRSNVEGAIITVDGRDIGTAPLDAPVRLTVGNHAFSARATDYDSPSTRVDVPGATETTVELTLRRAGTARGLIRVRTVPAEGVTVLVDGREVGVSPLHESIPAPPGPVIVTARRPGYRDATATSDVAEGAELTVELELAIDSNAASSDLGELRLEVPDEPATLLVDGRPMEMSSTVLLPRGGHTLRLTLRDRQPVRETVSIEGGSETVLRPRLEWTDQARSDRVDAAKRFRIIGYAIGAIGVVAAGVSAAVLAWNQPRVNRREELDALLNGPDGCFTLGRDCGGLEDEFEELGTKPLYGVRYGSIAGLGIGVIALGVGLTLVLLADSDEDIDAAAGFAASLRVGPGGVALTGSF